MLQRRRRLFAGASRSEIEPTHQQITGLGNLLKLRVVIFHRDFSLLSRCHVIIVSVLAGINSVGVHIVLMTEDQFTFNLYGESVDYFDRSGGVMCRCLAQFGFHCHGSR